MFTIGELLEKVVYQSIRDSCVRKLRKLFLDLREICPIGFADKLYSLVDFPRKNNPATSFLSVVIRL